MSFVSEQTQKEQTQEPSVDQLFHDLRDYLTAIPGIMRHDDPEKRAPAIGDQAGLRYTGASVSPVLPAHAARTAFCHRS